MTQLINASRSLDNIQHIISIYTYNVPRVYCIIVLYFLVFRYTRSHNVLTSIVYRRCIRDVLAPCDIWHDVSKSLRLSRDIINVCALGDRLPKGIACLTIEKPLRGGPVRRFRVGDGDCVGAYIGIYIYIYLCK